MNNIFYCKEGIVKASVFWETKSILIVWESLSNDKIVKECSEVQLDLFREGIEFAILDVSNTKGVLNNERQQWFKEFYYPELSKCNIKAMINVIPQQSALTKLASKRWAKSASSHNLNIVEVASVGDAQAYISEYSSFTV